MSQKINLEDLVGEELPLFNEQKLNPITGKEYCIGGNFHTLGYGKLGEGEEKVVYLMSYNAKTDKWNINVYMPQVGEEVEESLSHKQLYLTAHNYLMNLSVLENLTATNKVYETLLGKGLTYNLPIGVREEEPQEPKGLEAQVIKYESPKVNTQRGEEEEPVEYLKVA